jgi:membrane-bound lytic murein transglycosylase F
MQFDNPAPTRRPPPRLAALLIALLLVGCGPDRYQKQPGELLVGILDDPVFYQPAAQGTAEDGFEFDLLQAFAESQQKKLRVVPARNPDKLRKLLDNGEIDFVAGLPVKEDEQVRYTSPLREGRALIIQHADSLPVFDTAALAGRVVEVQPGTVQETSLRELPISPPPLVQHPLGTNGIDLLQRVSEYRTELAATDSLHFDLGITYYPDLIVAQELPGNVAYAWGFRVADEALRMAADAFVDAVRLDGRLDQLHDQHFGHLKRITPIGATQFIDDMRTRLPRFRRVFQDAQAVSGLDWRLLAALAYQESKWDPSATSFTGVRGIMMLTDDTADQLGVDNRLDPHESIPAAARYLADLRDRLPGKVQEPDRLWMALAAYNLGMGHMNGARQIAATMRRDPNSWYEMKQVLPLLARPEYYQRLKAGRARGGEAVILVENVRTYYDILVRFEAPRRSPLQTGLAMQ